MPIADAPSPSSEASISRLRFTWRRVAPIARSSAISRDRWVTIIVNVFQMMKPPTNSATPAKTANRMLRNWKSWLIASDASFATCAPVTASMPCGTTARQPLGQVGWRDAVGRAHVDLSNAPGVPSTRCAVAVSK